MSEVSAGDESPADAPESRVLDAVETLNLAYFGFIMSTGIVSIAFRELGIDAVAWPLAVFNVACDALLLVPFGVRVLLCSTAGCSQRTGRGRTGF